MFPTYIFLITDKLKQDRNYMQIIIMQLLLIGRDSIHFFTSGVSKHSNSYDLEKTYVKKN